MQHCPPSITGTSINAGQPGTKGFKQLRRLQAIMLTINNFDKEIEGRGRRL